MVYLIHHIYQTSRPLIFPSFQLLQNSFNEKKLQLFGRNKKSHRKSLSLKNRNILHWQNFLVALKMKIGCRTEWHLYNLINMYENFKSSTLQFFFKIGMNLFDNAVFQEYVSKTMYGNLPYVQYIIDSNI